MKTDKNRKQRGSVLLTVVFVMSILIVFLFGTMALAVANNNRAHVNYSSAQTGITARAVAEAAIRAIDNGTSSGQAYADLVGDLGPGGDPIRVPVQVNNSADHNRLGSLGHVEDVIITHAGTKQYYDVTKKSWETRDLLKFTATVRMSGVESTSSVYVLKHEEDDDEGSSSGGAGFVTIANASLPCQTNIVGGAYITLPDLDTAKKYVYSNKHVYRDNDRTGSLNPDDDDTNIEGFGKIQFKDGGHAEVVKTNDENGNVFVPNAFFAQNEGAIVEADLFVNNNMYIQNWSGFVFPGPKTGITVWGDLVFAVNSKDDSKCNYIYLGDKSANLGFTDVPYIYVDGTITGEKGLVTLGNKSDKQDFPLNIFCGTIECGRTYDGADQGSVITGNLYCMDEGGENVITIDHIESGLYNWSESVVKKIHADGDNVDVRGQICSNGNLTLGGTTVEGDVRVEGDLKLESNVTINGNVVVGGHIYSGDTIDSITNLTVSDGYEIYNEYLKSDGERIEVEIPNEVGYYYVYTPELDKSGLYEGKYVAPNGALLDDGTVFVGGEFQKDATIEDVPVPEFVEDIRIYYTMKQDGDRSIRPTDPEAIDSIDFNIQCRFAWGEFKESELDKYYADIEPLKRPGPGGRGEHDDNDLEGFYIKTSVVSGSFTEAAGPGPGGPGGPGVDGKYSIEHGGQRYEYKISTDYVKVAGKTFTYRYSKGGATYPKPEEYLESVNEETDYIYPRYAKRLVILGLDDDNGVNYGAEGKIVRTMEEVLKDVANPYEAAELPEGVSELLSGAKDNVLTSLADGKDFEGNDCYVITENCTLNIANVDKNILITPGENNMLIVIDNLSIQNGKNIFIDDSKGGGNVYFYITGDLVHNGNGGIITKTYYNATKGGGAKFSYNSSTITGYTAIKDLVGDPTPNVFIYGAEGSSFTCQNMGLITANIISPYLELSIHGGTGSGIESFVYNNYDVIKGNYYAGGEFKKVSGTAESTQVVIGCVNVNSAYSKNMLNCIYIPSDDKEITDAYKKDKEFWYKVLYYSEF